MCVNTKMIPVKTIPGIGGEGKGRKNGIMYNIFNML
jgi:hypothetical protein